MDFAEAGDGPRQRKRLNAAMIATIAVHFLLLIPVSFLNVLKWVDIDDYACMVWTGKTLSPPFTSLCFSIRKTVRPCGWNAKRRSHDGFIKTRSITTKSYKLLDLIRKTFAPNFIRHKRFSWPGEGIFAPCQGNMNYFGRGIPMS
jgi:hypothetical protein